MRTGGNTEIRRAIRVADKILLVAKQRAKRGLRTGDTPMRAGVGILTSVRDARVAPTFLSAGKGDFPVASSRAAAAPANQRAQANPTRRPKITLGPIRSAFSTPAFVRNRQGLRAATPRSRRARSDAPHRRLARPHSALRTPHLGGGVAAWNCVLRQGRPDGILQAACSRSSNG